MSHDFSHEQIRDRLLAFVREELLEEGSHLFDERSPLLGSGLIDSVRSAKLLTFVRLELGVALEADQLTMDNFRDVSSLAALVDQQRG